MRVAPFLAAALLLVVPTASAAADGAFQRALDGVDPRASSLPDPDVAWTDVPASLRASRTPRSLERAGDRRFSDAFAGTGDLGLDPLQRDRGGWDPAGAGAMISVGSVTRVDGADLSGVPAALARQPGTSPVTVDGLPATRVTLDDFGFAYPGTVVALLGDRLLLTDRPGDPVAGAFGAAVRPSRWSRSGSARAAVRCLGSSPLGAAIVKDRGGRLGYATDGQAGHPRQRVCAVAPLASARKQAARLRRSLRAGRVPLQRRMATPRVSQGRAGRWGSVRLTFRPRAANVAGSLVYSGRIATALGR